MKVILFSATLLLAVACGGPPKSANRFDPSADPSADVAAAVKRVEGTTKAVVLEVGGDWCSDTRALDAIFEGDPTVSRLLDAHFELVRIHRGREGGNEAFLKQYPRFDGVPHLFLLDSQGRLEASASGEAMVTRAPREEAPQRAARLLQTWADR